MEDEIRDFFANLTPEQLINNTAFFERQIPAGAKFDSFIDEHMAVLRVAYAACDGNIFPIATIATDTSVHYFSATDDETLGEFTQRIADFAATHHARWVFIFKKVRIRTDSERLVVYWFAGERHNDLSVDYRQGYFETLEKTLGDCIETEAHEQPQGFRTILEGEVSNG